MSSGKMKGLIKDTAIYGISSILGRFLNWVLTPLHVYIFINPSEFGQVNHLYGNVALLLVVLTFGMETGFFRFINKEDEKANVVYSTILASLAASSLLFVVLCFAFVNPIAELIRYPVNNSHILIMAVVVAMDAFMTIPYAKLRADKRPIRFVTVRLSFIVFNIILNLFFLLLCPWLYKTNPGLVSWFYNPDYGIGYIFLANLLAKFIEFILLSPYLKVKFQFCFDVLKRILKYSFPLVILGVAGITSHVIVQLLYPYLFDDITESQYMTGVYMACFRLTMVIALFTQAFRYAYEPFVFSNNKEGDDRSTYAVAMKFFIIVALLGFLAVMFYLDFIKYFLSPAYYVGLVIVPIAMMGEIFSGIYFNLSIWYKLTDKTRFGASLSILGCVITVMLNIIFVPVFGFIASAWALFVCNFTIMIISYFLGQKYFKINYPLKEIAIYLGLAAMLYIIGMYVDIENIYLRYAHRTALLLLFVTVIIKRDLPLSEIPIINKLIRKK